MQMNKYEISSGSLIAVLNLIIESAPTRPRDKAREDFTIEIINAVVCCNYYKIFTKYSFIIYCVTITNKYKLQYPSKNCSNN